MEEKILGKISDAQFGLNPDRGFLYGLQLTFKMSWGGVGDGGKYTINISNECKWNKEERSEAINKYLINLVSDTLKKAKVNYVSQLIGKPVEITLKDSCFKDFRILTEVL